MHIAHTAPCVDFAAAAALRYVRSGSEGMRRVRHKSSFRYLWKGSMVTDRTVLRRIRMLAIPPAWQDVWICPDGRGHVQATGIDAKGRKQYRYHADWSAHRHQSKFEHVLSFGSQLGRMRARVDSDLRRPGLPVEKVLATVVSVMDRTGIRVGNACYAKQNASFGLSTLLDRHVKRDGPLVRFCFTGKKGVRHDIRLGSKRLSRLVMRCKELPGQDLFQFLKDGVPTPIESGMVNDYIRSITQGPYTCKDIRTWSGTVLALRALLEEDRPSTPSALKQAVNRALDRVADALGNTRAVCRKYYVHPRVIELFEKDELRAAHASTRATAYMDREERTVLRLLRLDRRLRRAA